MKWFKNQQEEQIAEEKILKEYEDTDILEATILKIAHHGSKTSSTIEFLEEVKPKIALIGVGKENKFGHPNSEILKRIEKELAYYLSLWKILNLRWWRIVLVLLGRGIWMNI